MPSRNVVDRFVETVVGGDHVGAIERFYVPGASMRENQAEPRVGREGLMRHEEGVMGAFQSIETEIIGPALIDGDHVAIQWKFTFTPRGGETRTLQEIAWQRWEGDKIAEETFFYDPRQMAGA
ncbi:MAG: nuclear transport factor 2 family protein [Caulobacteraceae bacterium]